VAIKFIAPKIDEIPAKCKLSIAQSTLEFELNNILVNGGYIVQPAETPVSSCNEIKRRYNDGINNQKLRLFRRGKAISGAPIIKGTNQLPNPPIKIGITIKKIIIKP